MKKLTKSGIFLILLAFFACSKDSDLSPVNSVDDTIAFRNGGASGNTMSSTSIYNCTDDVMGTSTLHRTDKGVTMNFKTSGLIAGNAYTVWWVIFGDAPGPPVLVTHAAGHVAGGSGTSNFSSHLSAGDIFNNPLTAEIHLAVRTHGPVQPDMMPDQILTIDGGCLLPDIGFPSGPALYPDSDVVGYCANIQVAMHPGN